jgi:type I restriction enzyme S subunit
MSFPRYPEYKDSGVEWLGEVPDGWDICPLNYRYEIALGKMLDQKRISGNYLAPYLRNTDVQWGAINTDNLPQMDFEGDDLTRYSLRRGDLLVCEGGEVGRAAIWEAPIEECYYQKALHRLRARNPKRDAAELLYYVFSAASALEVFSGSGGKSTIAHLPAETLRRHRFPFPTPAEQIAIAAFLDRETAKIDALVAEQQRLMELLKEKRQAVISYAVTKGLNPDAPMKDSGIEWLPGLGISPPRSLRPRRTGGAAEARFRSMQSHLARSCPRDPMSLRLARPSGKKQEVFPLRRTC